jgi:hypothetical protein
MRLLRIAAIASFVVVAASGCSQPSPSSNAPIDQANLCEVKEWNRDAVSSLCKPGQKVVFLPSSFGNEQFPVIFAAVNCDLRYNVLLTTGAVTCIYGPITPTKAKGEERAVPDKP